MIKCFRVLVFTQDVRLDRDTAYQEVEANGSEALQVRSDNLAPVKSNWLLGLDWKLRFDTQTWVHKKSEWFECVPRFSDHTCSFGGRSGWRRFRGTPSRGRHWKADSWCSIAPDHHAIVTIGFITPYICNYLLNWFVISDVEGIETEIFSLWRCFFWFSYSRFSIGKYQ